MPTSPRPGRYGTARRPRRVSRLQGFHPKILPVLPPGRRRAPGPAAAGDALQSGGELLPDAGRRLRARDGACRGGRRGSGPVRDDGVPFVAARGGRRAPQVVDLVEENAERFVDGTFRGGRRGSGPFRDDGVSFAAARG